MKLNKKIENKFLESMISEDFMNEFLGPIIEKRTFEKRYIEMVGLSALKDCYKVADKEYLERIKRLNLIVLEINRAIKNKSIDIGFYKEKVLQASEICGEGEEGRKRWEDYLSQEYILKILKN